jgi:epoxyqueuosine reductase QueG
MDNKYIGQIAELASEIGFCLFGVADIREIKGSFLELAPETLARFDRAISLAVRLSEAVVDDIVDHPTPLYLHHYRQANAFLDRGAFEIARRIQEMGRKALPIAASQLVDWKKQQGHLSHKEIARRAGLGWIGRSNLLVTPQFGARVRLVTVLTDLPLEAGSPLPDDCGKCGKCLAACPAGAIKERREDFDHVKCYEQLKLFKNKFNIPHHICGLCVKACPIG